MNGVLYGSVVTQPDWGFQTAALLPFSRKEMGNELVYEFVG